ncbi:tyrosine-type recombinase/integrase [Imbroritus primus]|uniref:tyrosine-type recombinase/integrase n=1 Tax=Imbroritus primus TaxID=3058603 RepID=UPI003D161E64
MRHINYTLTPTRLNNAKPKEKAYKLTDGGGLFVMVMPGGAKTWIYQYTLDGKRREVTIGRYPEIGVADARDRHTEYRAMVERGENPAAHKRIDRAERKVRGALRGNEGQFKEFTLKWIEERLADKTESYRKQIRSRLERFVWPSIGHMALEDVKPAHVLAIIEARRSTPNTAEGVRIIIQQAYNYAIQKLLVETNPAAPLSAAAELSRLLSIHRINANCLSVAFKVAFPYSGSLAPRDAGLFFCGWYSCGPPEREQSTDSEGNREGNSIPLTTLCRIGAGFQPIYIE